MFVTEVAAGGGSLVFSTFLEPAASAGPNGIAVDSGGNIYVTGGAGSQFTTTTGAARDHVPAERRGMRVHREARAVWRAYRVRRRSLVEAPEQGRAAASSWMQRVRRTLRGLRPPATFRSSTRSRAQRHCSRSRPTMDSSRRSTRQAVRSTTPPTSPSSPLRSRSTAPATLSSPARRNRPLPLSRPVVRCRRDPRPSDAFVLRIAREGQPDAGPAECGPADGGTPDAGGAPTDAAASVDAAASDDASTAGDAGETSPSADAAVDASRPAQERRRCSSPSRRCGLVRLGIAIPVLPDLRIGAAG